MPKFSDARAKVFVEKASNVLHASKCKQSYSEEGKHFVIAEGFNDVYAASYQYYFQQHLGNELRRPKKNESA
jgi:hypothetical protein